MSALLRTELPGGLDLDRQRVWLTAVVFGAGALLYGATYLDMFGAWGSSGTFGHCFLIAPIAAYLVWRKRDELARTPRSTSLGGVGLAAAAALLWVLADILALQVAKHLAAVAFIPAIIWAMFGAQVAKCLRFPLLYLFLAVPFGEFAVPLLMEWTADFAVGTVRLFGLPVFREGMFFSLPSGDFEVAKACSGIRYAVAGLALSLLYAHLTMTGTARIAAFVVAALGVTVLANAVRAAGIVLLAHVSNMRLAAGVDHIIYGWLFFGLVAAFIIWIGRYFEDAGNAQPQPPAPSQRRPGRPLIIGGLLLVALASGPVTRTVAESTPVHGLRTVVLPDVLGDWRGAEEPGWLPRYIGAQVTLTKRYESAGRTFAVFVARYDEQHQGAELINSENRLVTGANERILRTSREQIPIGGQVLDFNVDHVSDGVIAREIWYWYVVGNRHVYSGSWAKLAELRLRLRGDRSSSAVFAVSAVASQGSNRVDWLPEQIAEHYAALVASAALESSEEQAE